MVQGAIGEAIGLSIIVRNARWVDGQEVGGDYTYVKQIASGEVQAVRVCVLEIHPPTCTVSILESRIIDQDELDDNQRSLLAQLKEVDQSEVRLVRVSDLQPRVLN